MPTGSFIPHLYTHGKPMPPMIYITWLIFGLKLTFYGGRTYIELETNRQQYLLTKIVLWHGKNDFWHPEDGPIVETVWKTEIESQHWVDLAHTLRKHGFPWATINILTTDIIQCQDAEIEGVIFGIRHYAHFD